MARPIKATQLDKEPIGYQSVTVRLPHTIIDALNTLAKGKHADFIRMAIEEKLKREQIAAPTQESPTKAK